MDKLCAFEDYSIWITHFGTYVIFEGEKRVQECISFGDSLIYVGEQFNRIYPKED